MVHLFGSACPLKPLTCNNLGHCLCLRHRFTCRSFWSCSSSPQASISEYSKHLEQPLECAYAGKASLGAGVGAYPLAYCTFGAACTEVELDALTGEQRILRADILFDCGRSMNPALDMGQVSVGPLLEPPLSHGLFGGQHKALAMPFHITPGFEGQMRPIAFAVSFCGPLQMLLHG